MNLLSLIRPRHAMSVFIAALSGLAGPLQTDCWALSIIPVAINTSGLNGQTGLLAFDFIDGDGLVNNTVTISGLTTDGTLSSTANFTIEDTGFFNEELRDITFGNFLNFTLQLTENGAPPGFDQFSFFLLDPISFLSLVGTSDPTSADAIFVVDITGAAGGNGSVFDPVIPGASWQVTLPSAAVVSDSAVPLPFAIFSMGLLAIGRCGQLGALRIRIQDHSKTE